MGKCQQLSSRYYGAFKVLKKIGDVAYRIELLDGIKAHFVFHVSKLKRMLHPLENVISLDILVELIKPPSTPHEPKRILGEGSSATSREDAEASPTHTHTHTHTHTCRSSHT